MARENYNAQYRQRRSCLLITLLSMILGESRRFTGRIGLAFEVRLHFDTLWSDNFSRGVKRTK